MSTSLAFSVPVHVPVAVVAGEIEEESEGKSSKDIEYKSMKIFTLRVYNIRNLVRISFEYKIKFESFESLLQ